MSKELTIHRFECIQSVQTITKENELLSAKQIEKLENLDAPTAGQTKKLGQLREFSKEEKEQLDIPLIKGKPGIIRVYFSNNTFDRDIAIGGEISIEFNNEIIPLESANSVVLKNRKGRQGISAFIDYQRDNIDNSLYFDLGPIFENSKGRESDDNDILIIRELRVEGVLQDKGKGIVSITKFCKTNTSDTKFKFERKPNLKLDVLGYRYYSERDNDIYQPNENSLSLMRSFVQRIFPTGEVEWDKRIIDAPPGFGPPFENYPNTLPDLVWQRKLNTLHAHTAMIRLIELDYCEDGLTNPVPGRSVSKQSVNSMFKKKLRSRYYGMVNDPENEFEGAASFVASRGKRNGRNEIESRPDCVAAGIAEEYSGYYGAHEIAHTLGALHHGVGDEQEEEDKKFQKIFYEQGKISTPSMRHIGFDYGDSKHPKKIFQWKKTFDIMSYENSQWISSYTYRGILKTLETDIETSDTILDLKTYNRSAHPEKIGNPDKSIEKYISVVGTYDFPTQSGEILYTHPTYQETLSRDFSDSESLIDFDKVVLIARYSTGLIYETFFYKKVIKLQIKREDHTDLPQASGIFHESVDRYFTQENGHVDFTRELKSLELYVDKATPYVHEFLPKYDVDKILPYNQSSGSDRREYRMGVKSREKGNFDYFLIFNFKKVEVFERRRSHVLDYRNTINFEEGIEENIKEISEDIMRDIKEGFESSENLKAFGVHLEVLDNELKSRGLVRQEKTRIRHASKYFLLVRPIIGSQEWRVVSLDVQPKLGVYIDKELITIARSDENLFGATIENTTKEFLYDVVAFQFRLLKVDNKYVSSVMVSEDCVVIQNPKNPKKFVTSKKDLLDILSSLKNLHTKNQQIECLYGKLSKYLA